jgi:hypothetical protein
VGRDSFKTTPIQNLRALESTTELARDNESQLNELREILNNDGGGEAKRNGRTQVAKSTATLKTKAKVHPMGGGGKKKKKQPVVLSSSESDVTDL